MGQSANDYSLRPSISDNGQHVAFESAASNIVNPDRNDQIDVILYDRSPITNRAALSGSPTINPGNSGIYHLIGEVPFSNYYILGSSSLGGFVYNYQYLELGDGIRLLESGTLDQNAEAFYQTPVIPPRLSGASFYIEAYVEQSLDVIDSNVFAISVL
jgi:hypothetical protein